MKANHDRMENKLKMLHIHITIKSSHLMILNHFLN